MIVRDYLHFRGYTLLTQEKPNLQDTPGRREGLNKSQASPFPPHSTPSCHVAEKMLQVFKIQKETSLKCKGQIVQCILCACRLEIKPTKDLPSPRKQGTRQTITKKSCETDLDGDLYRTSFKPEIPYCFLIKKQFLTEGKNELTMLSFHLKR